MSRQRGWTIAEERALRELAHFGAEACAYFFERTIDSVEIKARRTGISLRVREGGISDGKLTAKLCQRVRDWQECGVCPSCGLRPASVKRTGLCHVCHVRKLDEAQKDKLAEIEAYRDYEATKQRVKNLRRDLGDVLPDHLKADSRYSRRPAVEGADQA